MPRLSLPLTLLSLAFLASCIAPEAPQTLPEDTALPAVESDAAGQCWGRATRPAIYEETTGEVQVVPPLFDEDGQQIRAPIFRETTVPRVVRPRTEVRFEAVCPDLVDEELIASLQRALAVRSFYAGPTTGRFDPATRQALRSYQARRGLDSDQLSLTIARDFGLVAVDLSDL